MTGTPVIPAAHAGPPRIKMTPVEFVATMIGVVVAFLVLDQAQEFFAPVLSALVLGVVLSPVSRFWQRVHLRPSLAALTTLILVLVLLGTMAFLLEPYITHTIDRAPAIWRELREAIEGFRQMLRGLDKLSEDVAASVDPGGKTEDSPAMTMPTVTDALFYAPQFLGQVMVFAGTLYFFLLVRTEIYAWIGAVSGLLTRDDFEHAEAMVARYFLTISAINAVFGVLVAAAMQVLGMPSPAFWGMMAFVLNFILYLGPIALALVLLITGLVVFDGAISVVPAAVYMVLNTIEGQFVSPAFIGQKMQVNPLLVFLSLVFWLWLWGPIGGIIAIPLMIWTIAMTEAVMGQTMTGAAFRPDETDAA